MDLIGRKVLDAFVRDHADVRGAVDAWVLEVEQADWAGPDDVKARYASASLLADNRVIFNLKGNKYRLEVTIAYQTRMVLVKRIGTHAEYDRWM